MSWVASFYTTVMELIEGELVNITWKVMDLDKHLKKESKKLQKFELDPISQLNKFGLDYSKTEQQARLEKQSQNVKYL